MPDRASSVPSSVLTARAGTSTSAFASVGRSTPAEVSLSSGVNITSAADAPAFWAFSTWAVSSHGPAWTSAMSPLVKSEKAVSSQPPKPSVVSLTPTGVSRPVAEPDGEKLKVVKSALGSKEALDGALRCRTEGAFSS